MILVIQMMETVYYFTLIGWFATDVLIMNIVGYFLGLIIYIITLKIFIQSEFSINYSIYYNYVDHQYIYWNIIDLFPQYIEVVKDYKL